MGVPISRCQEQVQEGQWLQGPPVPAAHLPPLGRGWADPEVTSCRLSASPSWAVFAGPPWCQSKHGPLACPSGNEALEVDENVGGPGAWAQHQTELGKGHGAHRPWEPALRRGAAEARASSQSLGLPRGSDVSKHLQRVCGSCPRSVTQKQGQ